MKKLLTLLLFVLGWPAVSLADDAFNFESKVAVRTGYELFGGYVTDLAIDSTGRMYASTSSPNGIFTSTDNAATWSGPEAGVDMGKVNALVVSDEPNTAYLIGGTKLYKTTDSGSTWTELTGSSGDAGASDYSLGIAYASGVLAVPVRDGSIDVSTDEGATFTNVSFGENLDIRSLVGNSTGSTFYILAASDDADIRTLYVLNVADEAVMTTSLSGNYAWVRVKPTDDNFIIVAGSAGALYTTTGVSGTWQTLTTDSINGEINYVGDRIYLGDRYTDDLGATTTTLTVAATQLAVDPNDVQNLLLGSSVGVQHSNDGGENWETKTTGIVGVTVNDIAQSDNKKTVWLAAQGGLAHSTNFLSNDPTWEYPIRPTSTSTNIASVWVNPDNTEHLIAGTATLFYSLDGGTNWTEANGLTGLTGSFNDIVNDGTTLYAAYSGQSGETGAVYMSLDNGLTWESLNGPAAPVQAIAVLSDGKIVAAVGDEFNETTAQRGLYIYDGSTWTQQDIATDQAMMTVLVTGETIYAAGIGNPDGKVVRSQDNGTTWEDISNNGLPEAGYFQSLAAEPSTNTVYVATGRPAGVGYVYKSTDGGDNWSLLYTGLVDEEFNSMLFDGLTTGTTLGVQELQSKAKLTFTAKKTKLTIALKDAATKDPLNRRVIKLYKKTTKHGDWRRVQFAKTQRTNTNGKLTITVNPGKTSYYQARWIPKTADQAAYGETAYRSKRLTVNVQ